jgi:hypothetical protein
VRTDAGDRRLLGFSELFPQLLIGSWIRLPVSGWTDIVPAQRVARSGPKQCDGKASDDTDGEAHGSEPGESHATLQVRTDPAISSSTDPQDTDEEKLPDVDRKPVGRRREYDMQSVFGS